jgi:hypothetical protein
MEKMVLVLRAVSGAGKSTFTSNVMKAAGGGGVSVSADNFFMVDGNYVFIPSLLGEAHNACVRDFARHVMGGSPLVIVDNTSTSNIEAAVYQSLGAAHGYRVIHVVIDVDPVVAAGRNVHRVPLAGVMRQHESLMKALAESPPWWTIKRFASSTEAVEWFRDLT